MSASRPLTTPTLVARCDARPGVGWGHLARSQALCEAWVRAGGRAVIATDRLLPLWQGRADRAGVETVLVPDANLFPVETLGSPDWLVLDGYGFGIAAQELGRQQAKRVAVIDDYGILDCHFADLVIDQNAGSSNANYPNTLPTTRLLLGPSHALLRNEFHQARIARELGEPSGPAGQTTLLVSLGGEPTSVLARQYSTLIANVPSPWQVSGLTMVDDVPATMLAAHAALSAAGTTVWELACLGRPMALVAVAPNQEPVARAMQNLGAAMVLDPPPRLDSGANVARLRSLLLDADVRATLSTRASELVDGQGAARVTAALRAAMLEVRPVQPDEGELLLAWANDPAVRAASWSTAPIPRADHLRWLERRHADPRTIPYLALTSGTAIGQIRFDVTTEAEIGFSVAEEYRGHGFGPALLIAGVQQFRHDHDPDRLLAITAWVKAGNPASAQAFLIAGFRETTANAGARPSPPQPGARRFEWAGPPTAEAR